MKQPVRVSRIISFLASETFFRLTVGFLILQALWIVFSAHYPLPFDEDFHFGIIKLYAHHLSPFWQTHPANGDAYGAVARDPSYLYQYLMSFPLRFISLFTANQNAQIIILRVINVALFAASLPLFRRLLQTTGAAKSLIHVCLAVFVLLPIVPLLAAEINYDNLVLPLVAGVLLLTNELIENIQSRRALNVALAIKLLILCLLTSVVKYAYLPIFLAIGLFILYRFIKDRGFSRRVWQQMTLAFQKLELPVKLGLVVLLVIAGVLFIERDGLNIARYHRPDPDCADVLTVQQCLAYGPWNRDYYLSLSKSTTTPQSPITYTKEWARGMWFRTFFTLAGSKDNFETRGPLYIPAIGSLVLLVTGSLLLLRYGKEILKRHQRQAVLLLGWTSLVYVLFLWFDEYLLFRHAGAPVAINGRYLLIVMPFILLLFGMAFQTALRRLPRLQAPAALIILGIFLWGGGVFTFIIRSGDNWYWPNQAVRDANHAVQHVIDPVTPGSKKPVEFLP